MSNNIARPNSDLDAYIALIVRRVIAHLAEPQLPQPPTTQTQTTHTSSTAASVADKVITAATIELVPGSPSQVFVGAKAVVTPAARDAAKQRDLAIVRSVELPADQVPTPMKHPSDSAEITDSQQPERAAAVIQQLSRRGVHSIGTHVVLSDTPAADVHRYCRAASMRAVMVVSVADVDRFTSELHPNIWVLDMKRINLVAAVNIAAKLARKH